MIEIVYSTLKAYKFLFFYFNNLFKGMFRLEVYLVSLNFPSMFCSDALE